MSFKDRFNERIEKAEQKAAAQRKKKNAKIKAAEEKERKKLENPKYKTKMERKAEKARIAEEKRLVKVDKALTEIFNNLMNNDRAALKAIQKNDGLLTQRVGGFNNIGQYFKKGGGIFVESLGEITIPQIERNKAFQKYKDYMDKEGFDIRVVRECGSAGKLGLNSCKVINGTLAFPFLAAGITNPLFAPVSLTGLLMLSMSNDLTAEFSLEIKEKPPVEVFKDAEQLQGEALLDEINEQTIKEQEKTPVKQRNIIR